MNSRKLTLGLFAFYLIVLTWIILFKMQFSLRNLPHIQNVNWIPFGEPLVVNGKRDVGEIVQNAAAFFPMGIFVRALWPGRPLVKQLLPVIGASLLFEAAQYVFAIGASDITDVISNASGGALGIAAAALIAKVFGNRWLKAVNIVCLTGAIALSALIVVLLVSNL